MLISMRVSVSAAATDNADQYMCAEGLQNMFKHSRGSQQLLVSMSIDRITTEGEQSIHQNRAEH